MERLDKRFEFETAEIFTRVCVASIGLRGSDPASADSDYPQKTKEGAK